ncbi:hypothetical protein HPB52_022883 [Rhipicephalus sanguineus]|uniref:Uncharacterized protein n=1 Tax=Rhipicephalus sanguineus TaxID=34632 RepID=A0A9D4Q340_RHISA|nr:hypothetical protein HPB52_022883 [Rhipicephalus sanguineus]
MLIDVVIVLRVVTDNHQTNLSLFKSLSDDGTLSHVVPHPNHPIKNLRNNFPERELLDGDQVIEGGVYIKKLFEIQSQLLVKSPHGQQEEPLYATDDERLSWLEVDFINYIGDLQLSGGRSKQMTTKETYEATLLTTRSTVAVIEYLLDNDRFRYVLTRRFNSDSVESFFSCLRQFNGGNDRVDARAAIFCLMDAVRPIITPPRLIASALAEESTESSEGRFVRQGVRLSAVHVLSLTRRHSATAATCSLASGEQFNAMPSRSAVPLVITAGFRPLREIENFFRGANITKGELLYGAGHVHDVKEEVTVAGVEITGRCIAQTRINAPSKHVKLTLSPAGR